MSAGKPQVSIVKFKVNLGSIYDDILIKVCKTIKGVEEFATM